ncbi:hypothetical protein LEMLEM_LOCUS1863 [Lemmus lemmus]
MPKTSVMKNYIFSGNLNASRIIATLQGPTLDYRHHLLTVR